jgi:hypothetical protein
VQKVCFAAYPFHLDRLSNSLCPAVPAGGVSVLQDQHMEQGTGTSHQGKQQQQPEHSSCFLGAAVLSGPGGPFLQP